MKDFYIKKFKLQWHTHVYNKKDFNVPIYINIHVTYSLI